uniref:Plastocyanin-like domain-containing protein n=1 Tax=Anopheles christyi TaxID=43041 RepID=A0A182K9A9_9DIPT
MDLWQNGLTGPDLRQQFLFHSSSSFFPLFAVSAERAVSCDRVCNRADWPRICRFELVVEKRTFRHGSAPIIDKGLLAEGSKSIEPSAIDSYYTVNGRYVGPTLTVCENDFLVVDVENRIPGESISLHWTGQSQRRTPFMDGVPMITQCPIASFTRFQYKFQADKAGTHLYHGFTGTERTHGLIGAFVVRSPYEQRQSPVLSVLRNDPVWLVTKLNGLLGVNGQRNWTQTSNNGSLRVRLVYAVSHCQHWLELEDHDLHVLALDGNVLDHNATSLIGRILLHDGVRMDLTLIRRGPPVDIERDYEIRFSPPENRASSCGRAVFHLRYGISHRTDAGANGAESIKYNLITPPTLPHPSPLEDRPWSKALDLTGADCVETEVLCPQDLPGGREQFPKDLQRGYDARFEFTISSRHLASAGPFGDPIHETVHSVNGFTFAFPSVLMVREPANSELWGHTCGGHRTLPRSCHPLTGLCECVHVEHIEAGHRVEMVLINADAAVDYVYHLHGQGVFVVEVVKGHRTSAQGKMVRRLAGAPLQRDTIVVRRDSIVVVRFVAKNAGLWLLRDIGSPSWSRGLDVVLNVGHSPQPDIPSNFPACRHFVGPRYFLI